MGNYKIMYHLIKAFPDNLKEALGIYRSFSFKKDYSKFQNIVICGLGGSGIGGKLVQNWFADEINVPITICQAYDLPNFVTGNTLLIASSYSGNTEETLALVSEGMKRKAQVIAICSGGELMSICQQNGLDFIKIPGGNPPRTQLAFSLVQLCGIFSKLGLISEQHLTEIEKAATKLNSEQVEIQKEAEFIADKLVGKSVIVYSCAKEEALAIRARQQFNENSKILCNHHVMPEMNHNELVGWAGGSKDQAVIFIETSDAHPQNIKRIAFSKSVISQKTENIIEVMVDFQSKLVESLYIIHLLDWASYYLSEMNQVDPIEIEVIDKLKNTLSK
jgi:glucose/mannose-6-phosphate isomerase